MNRGLRLRSGRITAAREGGDTPGERILLQPHDYVGSMAKCTETFWVLDAGLMKQRALTYSPGLHHIFDEILLYAASNKRRDPAMSSLCVEVDVVECRVSVFYNGRGIPVELRDENNGIYAPEMFFGRFHDSSSSNNNNDDGYGVKLANLFSTEFVVETADGCRMKKYRQVRRDCLILLPCCPLVRNNIS
uniref:DNA topoisomerase (ATP-hydrolyzing) n=1 Tax=Leersia perrieri TaxID=77586 RepID=A0A0D9UYX7_9ORYZ